MPGMTDHQCLRCGPTTFMGMLESAATVSAVVTEWRMAVHETMGELELSMAWFTSLRTDGNTEDSVEPNRPVSFFESAALMEGGGGVGGNN